MTSRPVSFALALLTALTALTALLPSTAFGQLNGKVDTVQSTVLHEPRRIIIYLPNSYHDGFFYPRRYPVLYLLDGESHFNSVSGFIQLLSETRGQTAFPELIVVAITNTDRMRDLSPTRPIREERLDSIALTHTGGGPQFVSFLRTELIPYIEKTYRTAPYRVLMGHSLGGLTVVNTFVHHTDLFNAYIATDPSMSWDDSRLLKEARATLQPQHLTGRSLFIGIANNLQDGADTTRMRTDSANLFHRHMRSIFALRDLVLPLAGSPAPAYQPFSGTPPEPESLPAPGPIPFRCHWKYYPDYDHQASPLPAEYDGLRFVFQYYGINMQFPELFQPSWSRDSLLETHYRLISRMMGYTESPPEILVNSLGYGLMGAGQLDRAAYYFAMNIRNYPKSFNVYDSMGDLLVARQQKDSAIKCYQQSLILRENKETREKMERLKQGH